MALSISLIYTELVPALTMMKSLTLIDSSSHKSYSQGSNSGKGNEGSFTPGNHKSLAHAVSVVEEKYSKFLDKHWDGKNQIKPKDNDNEMSYLSLAPQHSL